jgi:hypothetical protein
MSRWILIIASSLALVGCFSPIYPNGKPQCNADHPCPPGLGCGCDNHCYQPGTEPGCGGSGQDMGPSPDILSPPPPTLASPVWTSCGGGSSVSTSGSGTTLNMSVGGSVMVGRAAAPSNADITLGYFGDQIY